MGVLGWKLLEDEARLSGTLDHLEFKNNDGDVSVHVRVGPDDGRFLTHDGVTNHGDYQYLVECEVKPTGRPDELQRWLERIPVGNPVIVGGPWVSDCSHSADGTYSALITITGGIQLIPSTVAGKLPGYVDEFLSPITSLVPMSHQSLRDFCCDHGKTEIHPIQYLVAPLASVPAAPEPDSSFVQRVLVIVLTDSDAWFPIYRPALPPHSGEPVVASISIAFPSSLAISAGLTDGSIAPVCAVATAPDGTPDELNNATTVSMGAVVGEGTTSFALGDRMYDRAAFASVNVETGNDGSYYGVLELRFDPVASAPLGEPAAAATGVAPAHPEPARLRLAPLRDESADLWNGSWAEHETGSPRLRVEIAANPTLADHHDVALTDTVLPLTLRTIGVSAVSAPVAPYRGDVWPSVGGTISVRTGAVRPAGLEALSSSGTGMHVRTGAVSSGSPAAVLGRSSAPRGDELVLSKNTALFIYGAFDPEARLRGSRIRYVHVDDDGRIVVDVMLSRYASIR